MMAICAMLLHWNTYAFCASVSVAGNDVSLVKSFLQFMAFGAILMNERNSLAFFSFKSGSSKCSAELDDWDGSVMFLLLLISVVKCATA